VNDPIDEKTLQEYLSGNSPVSQRYRELEASEVPAHLDELVLRQSRDAVVAAPSVVSLEQSRLRQSRRRLLLWSVPATLAASTVLVLSIVIESGNQHLVTAPAPASAPAPAEQGAAETRMLDAAPSAVDALEKDKAPEPQPPASASAERRSQKALSMRAQKSADVAAPAAFPQSAKQAPSPAEEVTVTEQRKRESVQDSPAAVVGLTSELPTPLPSTPPKIEEFKAAPAQPMRSEPSAAGSVASRESADVDLSEVIVTGSNVRRPAQVGPRGTIAPATSSFSRADESPAEPSWRAQPETWLEHIRELRKDGSSRAADKEWKKFRAAYPDYEVAETDSARSK
jgi:hypothetical protein